MPKTNDKNTRARRRAEAEERQAKYNSLSVEQRIEQIKDRPGSSVKEMRRLLGLAEQDKAFEKKVLANPELVAALDKGVQQAKEGKGEVRTRRRRTKE